MIQLISKVRKLDNLGANYNSFKWSMYCGAMDAIEKGHRIFMVASDTIDNEDKIGRQDILGSMIYILETLNVPYREINTKDDCLNRVYIDLKPELNNEKSLR
jgi:hypothetical protein